MKKPWGDSYKTIGAYLFCVFLSDQAAELHHDMSENDYLEFLKIQPQRIIGATAPPYPRGLIESCPAVLDVCTFMAICKHTDRDGVDDSDDNDNDNDNDNDDDDDGDDDQS